MVNRVTLIGNLGKDPEIRRLENGAIVAKFSIATNEYYRDKSGELQQVTEWHDVVAWRALAEQAERVLRKGKLIYLEGRLTHRQFQDKDGNNRYITEVLANMIKILDREKREGGENGSEYSSAPRPNNTGSDMAPPPPMEDDGMPF
jgi:single-strand DNA-binding protein